MAIYLNGKKVIKIMQNGKEIMSNGGMDINEWIAQIQNNKVIDPRSGNIEAAGGSYIFPIIEIPPDKNTVILNGVKNELSLTVAFYDKNEQFLSAAQSKKLSIPSGAKFLKYSYTFPQIVNFS